MTLILQFIQGKRFLSLLQYTEWLWLLTIFLCEIFLLIKQWLYSTQRFQNLIDLIKWVFLCMHIFFQYWFIIQYIYNYVFSISDNIIFFLCLKNSIDPVMYLTNYYLFEIGSFNVKYSIIKRYRITRTYYLTTRKQRKSD